MGLFARNRARFDEATADNTTSPFSTESNNSCRVEEYPVNDAGSMTTTSKARFTATTATDAASSTVWSSNEPSATVEKNTSTSSAPDEQSKTTHLATSVQPDSKMP